ncbi:MAG: hypothetical protein RR576_07930 [Oscillospiraceae bacterium]
MEIKFYTILFYLLFLLTGYEAFSLKGLFKTVFSVFYQMNTGFTGGFIALYLIIPFLNLLIENLNEKSHRTLILTLIFIYTITATFFFSGSWGYLGWYITIYLIGSYVRLYLNPIFENKKIYIWFSLISLALAWASILTIDFVGRKLGFTNYYFFVADSHKILALICSFAFFMLFKNIQMKPNRFINTVAASTFGVLMIHANSYTMIRFLWQDVLHNTSFYNSSWLIVHAVCSVLGVYVICVAIDYLRIKFLEKPLFAYLDKKKFLQ